MNVLLYIKIYVQRTYKEVIVRLYSILLVHKEMAYFKKICMSLCYTIRIYSKYVCLLPVPENQPFAPVA